MSAVPGAFGKPFNCPCCKNPWNQTDDAATGALFCAPCLSDDKGFKGIDPANFDDKVSPRDNFYLWSNGGWKAANPIPLEYSSWNTFIVLRDLNLDRLKAILDELGSSPSESSAKLANYYSSFMDEATIEARGVSVLEEALKLCVANKVKLCPLLCTTHRS
jgi:predicted metalloendopeptidase